MTSCDYNDKALPPDATEGDRSMPLLARIAIVGAVSMLIGGAVLIWVNWHAASADPGWQQPGILGDFWGGHIAAASALASALFMFAAL